MDEQTSAAVMPRGPTRAVLWKVALAALAFGAGGTFAGNWAWHAYSDYQVAQRAQAEKAAIEAEAKSPRGRAHAALALVLYDGESARFRNEKPGKKPATWCGEVNARNRMGAMVGFSLFHAQLASDPKDDRVEVYSGDNHAGLDSKERIAALTADLAFLNAHGDLCGGE